MKIDIDCVRDLAHASMLCYLILHHSPLSSGSGNVHVILHRSVSTTSIHSVPIAESENRAAVVSGIMEAMDDGD